MRARTKSIRGKGRCGSPGCQSPRAPDRFVCAFHAVEMDRIRHEFQNEPRFNSGKKKGGASLPRCCKIGCYEVRIPPAAFCDAHSNEAQDD